MSDAHSIPRTDNEPPRHHKAFTSFGADVPLTTQSGLPPHAAQRLLVTNSQGTAQALVLRDVNGVDVAYDIPASTAGYRIDFPAVTIVASGTGTIAKVVAHWWQGLGYRLNP